MVSELCNAWSWLLVKLSPINSSQPVNESGAETHPSHYWFWATTLPAQGPGWLSGSLLIPSVAVCLAANCLQSLPQLLPAIDPAVYCRTQPPIKADHCSNPKSASLSPPGVLVNFCCAHLLFSATNLGISILAKSNHPHLCTGIIFFISAIFHFHLQSSATVSLPSLNQNVSRTCRPA